MSNSLAVSAVTTTMRHLLEKGLAKELNSGNVTAMPPDKVDTSSIGSGQVNLFLYHVSYDAAWRNMNMPNQVKPFETGFPPLPLVLNYLVTAYAKDDKNSDFVSHGLLGKAMSVLHDHPLLGTDEIKAALADSNLSEQIERVRITPLPVSSDEMSKLWTTFQTNYRISAAYQVSVVLIESTRQPKTPLPILTRGEKDKGIESAPDVLPPYPTLTGLILPPKQPSARLGEKITFQGFNLGGASVTGQFKHPRLKDPIALAGTVLSAEQAEVTIPAGGADQWPAGTYTVSLLVKRADDQDRVTNELAFALAPVICEPPPPLPEPPPDPLPPLPPLKPLDQALSILRFERVAGEAPKDAKVVVRVLPLVLPEQSASLLLSDTNARQIPAEPRTKKEDPLTFIILDAPLSGANEFYARLRIDGVDSLLVKDYDAKPPVFDPTQRVVIHD
jgi:hypothetical protein